MKPAVVALACFAAFARAGEKPPRQFVETAHRHSVKVTVPMWVHTTEESSGYLAQASQKSAETLPEHLRGNNLDGGNLADKPMREHNATADVLNRELVNRFFQALRATFQTAGPNYLIRFAAPPVISAQDQFGVGWLDWKTMPKMRTPSFRWAAR